MTTLLTGPIQPISVPDPEQGLSRSSSESLAPLIAGSADPVTVRFADPRGGPVGDGRGASRHPRSAPGGAQHPTGGGADGRLPPLLREAAGAGTDPVPQGRRATAGPLPGPAALPGRVPARRRGRVRD